MSNWIVKVKVPRESLSAIVGAIDEKQGCQIIEIELEEEPKSSYPSPVKIIRNGGRPIIRKGVRPFQNPNGHTLEEICLSLIRREKSVSQEFLRKETVALGYRPKSYSPSLSVLKKQGLITTNSDGTISAVKK